MRTDATILCCALAFTPSHAQTFDVASVHPSHAYGEGTGRPVIRVLPDRVTFAHSHLQDCIQWAYELREYQVAGPDWIHTEKFDITGIAEGPSPPSRLRLMVRALLDERFHLVIHRETRSMSVFAIVAAKSGPKLSDAAPGAEPAMVVTGPGLKLSFTAQPIADLAGFLSSLAAVGRPVIDASGLGGRYTFTLDLNEAARPGLPEGAPSVSTVLQEQLGLRFDARRGPVDVWVVDHAEKLR